MVRNNTHTAEILKEEISSMELEAALLTANRLQIPLLEALTNEGHSAFRLFSCIAAHCGWEAIALTETFPPPTAAQLIPKEIAQRHQLVPISRTAQGLKIAIGDPMNIDIHDTIRYLLKEPVELVAALPEEIESVFHRLYAENDSQQSTNIPLPADTPTASNDEPIAQLVNLLIIEAFRQRASDIHLEPLANQLRVRFRIDGALQEVDGPPHNLHASLVSRIKIMAGMKISEKRLPQDGRIEIIDQGLTLDLRVSCIPSNHGESIVMRILDKQNLQPDLANLGFLPDDQQQFERLVKYPDGILLITGPTGSGKTTTLYSCLNHLNRPDRKIITVEDPVEYQLSGINQVHVHPNIGLTFSTALRSILRQAPNTIMIGEIRDQETAAIAINAALTGHLVLSTLHTNDAPSAVTRLADIGIKPFLISSALRGIMAQRLVRTICKHCKSEYTPTEAETKRFSAIHTLYSGHGCPECRQTGYHGRKGIFELLNINDEIKQMIYSGATASELRSHARSQGMRTLREDGIRKAINGTTTLNEVLRVTMRDEN